MYKLAVCAVFRDEEDRLHEWLDWHRLVGVEHFYLYDNNRPGSGDADPMPVLRPYLDAGWVTLEPRPGEKMQLPCYDLTIRRRPPCTWLAVIDIDEFLVPMETWRVNPVLDHFERTDVSAIGCSWAVYGDSGLDAPPLLQTESFIRRAVDLYDYHANTKSIIRPERVVSARCPHYFVPQNGYRAVDMLGNLQIDYRVYPPIYRRLRVNHYRNRTRAEFLRKLRRGYGYTPGPRRDDYERWNRNEIEDPVTLRFVPALKQLMAAEVRPWPSGGLSDYGQLLL